MNSSHSTHADPKVIALVIVAVIGWIMVKSGGSLLKYIAKQVLKDGIAILVIRHFSGAHYHGRKPTDATWWTPGSTTSRSYNHDSWLSRWEHKPQGHRALWRTGCTFAVVGICYGLLTARSVTFHALESLVVYGLFSAAFVTESKIKLRVHTRHIVTPIVKSLAPHLRMSEHAVRRLVHIRPEDISDEGECGWIEVPDEITPGDDMRTSMNRIVDSHLPVDVELDFRLQQQPRMAVIKAGLHPPEAVTWEEMLEAMNACKPGEVVIGKDRSKQPYGSSFTDLDDPHWGFDVNTGYGKSNFLGVVAAQILHQDPLAEVTVIDPKRVSLIDYLGSPYDNGSLPLLPGVTMACNPSFPEEMCDAVARVRRILERRTEQAVRDRDAKFPCHLVIIDELNQFADIVADYWNRLRAEDRKRPREDREDLPADAQVWQDVRTILRTGRFVNVHILVVSQDFRDDAFGGKGARNYLGFKGMAGFNPSQWKKFIGTSPVPRAQTQKGRWIFTAGNEETWVQVTFADAERSRQLYDYAAEGRAGHQPEESVRDAALRSLTPFLDQEQTDGLLVSASETPQVGRRIVTGLDDASHYLDMTRAAFEKARQRTQSDGRRNRIPGEFRTGRQPSWYASDLDDWKRHRPGSKEDQDG